MKYLKFIISLVILSSIAQASFAKNQIVLKDLGILRAGSGVARYEMLYNAHKQALAEGKTVSYAGIDTLFLEIPKNAKSIELNGSMDFCNVVFKVTNNAKDLSLFTLSGESRSISVDKQHIDCGNFTEAELKKGNSILIISDKNVWSERIGHSNASYRKDAILVKKGKAKNSVCSPYNDNQSNPECFYFPASRKTTVVRNMHLVRTAESSKKTFLIKVLNRNNISLENLSVRTPSSDLYADHAIWIENSYDVRMNNINIEGTYSLKDKYGYGIQLENVTLFKASNIVGTGNWGLFGTNNVNTPYLSNCDINRFDIHCYGKDVTMENCTIRDFYNQFSCVFGTIKFKGCRFINATPYVDGGSYNTNVKHEVVMEDCVFDASSSNNSIINILHIRSELNGRSALREKYLPDVEIRNLTVNTSVGVKDVYLYKIGALDYKGEMAGGETSLKEIKFNGKSNAELKHSNRQLKIKNK